MNRVKVPMPIVCPPGECLIARTFGEKQGVELRTTKDLMDWIVFGDPKPQHGGVRIDNNDF